MNLKNTAKQIGILEALVYPPEVRMGWKDFLSDFEEYGTEFLITQFDGEDLVAYFYAYPEEGVLYVSDIATYHGISVGMKMVFLRRVRSLIRGMRISATLRPDSQPMLNSFIEVVFGHLDPDYFDDGVEAFILEEGVVK